MTARGADIQRRLPFVFKLLHVFKGPVRKVSKGFRLTARFVFGALTGGIP